MVLSLLAMMVMHVHPSFGQLVPDDEKRIRWPAEEAASRFRRPVGPAPVTVATKDPNTEERYLPLDEAIQLALNHSEVIRVLTGVSATNSGQTIYDTAIAVTPIDVAKAPFDPVFRANTAFRRNETPFLNGAGTAITGSTSGGNVSGLELSDRNQLGGTSRIASDYLWESHESGGFDYLNAPGLEVSYTQPLLSGAGFDANRAPIVIARLRQEQSYFQFKNSIQGLVNDVITGYWALVQARTELLAIEIQLEQLQYTYDRAAGRKKFEFANIADVAQAETALATTKARAVQARGNVLQREAALRNLFGLPPEDGFRLVPSTPPTRDRVEFRWDDLVDTAQSRRPDLIELNLVLMADQQQLVRNRNLAQPSLDAQAIHRWDGLQGRTVAGQNLNTPFDNHTDWTLGVTFEVPLSLRASRANLRNSELLIARDRANIDQSLHQVEHSLATTLRSIEQNLEQYEAFRAARLAAEQNVEAQRGREKSELTIILNELLAITEKANAALSEAQALAAYNTQLANLEFQTGTILETHGIRFVEERFASIGPHGRHHESECYPRDLRPTEAAPRYEDSQKPSEEVFGLKGREGQIRTRASDPNATKSERSSTTDPEPNSPDATELPAPSSRDEYDPIPK